MTTNQPRNLRKCRSRKRSVATRLVLLVALFCLYIPVSAFKPKTHVWIGQQVLNDVTPDGKITIPPFGELDVPLDVVEALRRHPKEYLMGLVGPDGFPDPVVGQTTVHPGEPIKNDEWLRFLLSRSNSPAGKAFVYGFLAHAASDMMAHTWVNLYAGDSFELKDGQEEEVRHIAIEDHVARATPPLADAKGTALGTYRDAVGVPADFVRQVLLIDAVSHYRAVPSAQHLVAMVEIRSVIADASQKANELDGALKGFYLGPAEALIKAGEDAIQAAIDAHDRLRSEQARLEKRLAELPNEIKDLDDAIRGIENEIDTRASQSIRDACVVTCCALAGGVGCAVDNVRNRCNDDCNDLHKRLTEALNAKNAARDKLKAEKARFETDLLALPSKITEAKRQLETKTANAALAEARKVREVVMRLLKDGDLLRAVLRLWLEDIDKALNAYIEAGEAVSRNMVEGSGSLIEPYKQWLSCWAPAFKGTASKLVAQGMCATKELLADFKEAYDDFLNALGDAAWIIDPVGKAKREAMKLIQPEIDKAVARAEQQVLQMLAKEFADALQLLAEGSDPGRLNSIFERDESGKALLSIPNVAARLDSDMHRSGGTGPFDPLQFNAVYNSVVLAKLSLLNEAGLTELIRRVPGANIGLPEYARLNILNGLAKNIDGNHQWQRHAPPYFRTDGYSPKANFRTFGYGLGPDNNDDGQGLVLWRDPGLRTAGFLQIFHGPIAPALENSCPKQFPDLVHPSYPFRTCTAHPFADSLVPSMCTRKLTIESVNLIYDPGTVEFVRVEAMVRNTGGIPTATIAQSEIFPEGSQFVQTQPPGKKAIAKKRSSIFSDRAKTDVVCDNELVKIQQTVFVRPFLKGGVYPFTVSLYNDAASKQADAEFVVKDGLPVAACIAQHRVRRGDTLEGLAKRYRVSSWRVSARNRISNLDQIKRRTILCIPPEAAQ
jgi:hypothetical protein